ncbi:MAG: hypothetical protein R8G01_09345 [Ilumatobacteraceae bacterium]|nr:hypothetical protein [Ilumatobacteraceae bacterium]
MSLDAVAVLWPDEVGQPTGSGPTRSQRLVALPDSARPRQLHPWHWASIRATASRRSDDRPRSRIWRDTAGLAGLLSIGALASRRRLQVRDDDSLVAHIAEVLGLGEPLATVLCGPERANQKPVVQLYDRRGKTLMYVKVAWSDLTRRLLRSELHALTHLARTSTRGFAVPEVVATGDFGAATWLALTPVSTLHHRPPTLDAHDELARLIQATGVTSADSTEKSKFVELLRRETMSLRLTGPAVAQLTAQHADRALKCGASHGDFVPWNILSGAPEAAVWDWERYRLEAPAGFDRFHFRVQTGMHRRQQALPDVLSDVRTNLDEIVPELDPIDRHVHFDWYVADLLGRYERDGGAHPSAQLATWTNMLHQALQTRLETS